MGSLCAGIEQRPEKNLHSATIRHNLPPFGDMNVDIAVCQFWEIMAFYCFGNSFLQKKHSSAIYVELPLSALFIFPMITTRRKLKNSYEVMNSFVKSTEKFAEFIRKMMDSINLYDDRGSGAPRITKPRELEELRPGDLILYDLRYHQNPNYRGHTRILVEINENAWFWPYVVVEGHTGGGAAEKSRYAMDGWIFSGLVDSWRGPVEGKGRTWDCRIFR